MVMSYKLYSVHSSMLDEIMMYNDEHECVDIPSQSKVKFILCRGRGFNFFICMFVSQLTGNPILSKDQFTWVKASNNI